MVIVMEYETLYKDNEKRNYTFLKEFEEWLVKQGLANKTITRHLKNASFYINIFLTHDEIIPMEDGMEHATEFYSYFFIRKCMWSTPNTLSESCTSLKKFYECMCELNHVSKEKYDLFAFLIKECRKEWMEECEYYNNNANFRF